MKKGISIKANYMWSTAYQGLMLIVPLITAPYLSRVLGADGNGVASFTNSINSYFVMFATLGTGLFGQRNVAYHRNNKEALSGVFWEIFICRLISGLISLVLYGTFVLYAEEYRTIYWILTINIVNVVLDVSWFFQGVEEFKKTVIRNFIVKMLHTASIFLLVRNPEDLNLYVLLSVGFITFGNLSLWSYIPGYITKPIAVKPFRNIKDILLVFLPTMSSQVYVMFGKTLVGVLTDSAYQNGCLEQADRIVRIALSVVISAATVVLPRVANLFAEGNDKDAKAYIYKSYRFSGLLALPITFGLIGTSKIFVPAFFGPGYELVEILLPIMSVIVVAVAYAYVTGYAYLIATNQQNIYTISVIVGAVASLILDFLLIPYVGAIGAAVASVAAEVIGSIIQIAYCVAKKQLQIRYIFASIWKYLVAAFIMLISLLVTQSFASASLVSLVILVIQGVIVYSLLLLILRDDFFLDNTRKIMKKIRKTES